MTGPASTLSDHFFYFGSNAALLPESIRAISQQTQGHRARLNDPYLAEFVQWIGSIGLQPNVVLGAPQLDIFAEESKALNRCRCN